MNKLKIMFFGVVTSFVALSSYALTAEQITKCNSTGRSFVFNDRCIPNNPCNSKSQDVLDSYCVSAFENVVGTADLADMIGQAQDANPTCSPVPGEEGVVCTYPSGKKIGIKMRTNGKETLAKLDNQTKVRLSMLCEGLGGKILEARKGCKDISKDHCALLGQMLSPVGKESVGYTEYTADDSTCNFFINQEL